jgi:hypothetical protein
VNASDIHFTITAGGIATVIVGLMRVSYTLGKLLNRIDSHINESNEIHKAIGDRVTYLERRRRLNV